MWVGVVQVQVLVERLAARVRRRVVQVMRVIGRHEMSAARRRYDATTLLPSLHGQRWRRQNTLLRLLLMLLLRRLNEALSFIYGGSRVCKFGRPIEPLVYS